MKEDHMRAGDLVAEQYFKTSGCGDGNALYTLPRDKMRPDKVLGQIVFLYSPNRRFHSTQIRILDLDEEVVLMENTP